jgi:copper chaperone CopZ
MFKSTTFEVFGDHQLHCEGCEERVENALKSLQGVTKVRARSRNQRIQVLYDAAFLDAGAIAERINKVGYQTRVVDSAGKAEKS